MHIQDVLPRDAIPGIDDPAFGTEYIGDDDDEVIVVEATPARAYPVRILSYHEIVNDVLGGGGQPDDESNSPSTPPGTSIPQQPAVLQAHSSPAAVPASNSI